MTLWQEITHYWGESLVLEQEEQLFSLTYCSFSFSFSFHVFEETWRTLGVTQNFLLQWKCWNLVIMFLHLNKHFFLFILLIVALMCSYIKDTSFIVESTLTKFPCSRDRWSYCALIMVEYSWLLLSLVLGYSYFYTCEYLITICKTW